MDKETENQSGLSLLEVMITLGILVSMMLTVSTMMRGSFDIKFSLAETAKVTHRLNVAIRNISKDIEHAYILKKLDQNVTFFERSTGTIFKVDRSSDSDKLGLTTMSHRPYKANAKESDMAYVVYEVKKAEDIPGRSHLYRGFYSRVPKDFKEDPKMKILAKHIKSIKVEGWRGDQWYRDKWDTTRSDTRYILPHMARITVEAWVEDAEPGDELAPNDLELVTKYQTTVHLPYSLDFEEIKAPIKSLRL